MEREGYGDMVKVPASQDNGRETPPPSVKGPDVSGRICLQSQRLGTDTSFTDNLIDLFEGCRDEVFELRKKNLMQKNEISSLKIEARKWRRVAECYITSWDGVQEDLRSLRSLSVQLESAEESKRKLEEEMKLKEMEREIERNEMQARLEEREKELCKQRDKMEMFEKERLEMAAKLNELENMQSEFKTACEKTKVDGRKMSDNMGLTNNTADNSKKDHVPRMIGCVVGSSETNKHQKLRRAIKSPILPISVAQTHQSTKVCLLPSPPKASGPAKPTPRPSIRNLIPLQIR